MPLLVLITLILVAILTVSIRLLFRFSYDTFIPWDIGFGLFLYTVFFFCAFIGSEIYFFNTKSTPTKRFVYKFLPAILNVAIIGFVVYFFKIPDQTRCSDCGGAGLIYLFILVVWLSVTTTFFAILTQLRFDAPYDSIYEPDRYKRYLSVVRPLGKLIQKTALISIPVLIASISYVSFLTYSDYKATGMEYSYTDKSNHRLMFKKAQEDLNISFCNQINGVRGNELKPYCYDSFFKQIGEIKKFEDRSKNTPSTANFFEIFNKNKNEHCSRLKESELCEDELLKHTYEILELNAKALFKYASISVDENDEMPRYLIIKSYNNKAYKSIHSFIEAEVRRLLPDSVALIEESMVDSDNSTTIIRLDMKKLASHENEFIEASENLRSKRKSLSQGYAQILKEKEVVAREKARLSRIESDKITRKLYKLGPNDPIEYEPCPNNIKSKYLTGSADRCINGIRIPHAGSKTPLLPRSSK